jgi:hypothetical protein
MLKNWGVIVTIVVVGLPAAVLLAGQMNLLAGRRPDDLGVRDGLLKPPVSSSWNSVSSQAERHEHTDYHLIAPLRYNGDADAAFARLEQVVAGMPGASMIERRPDYLYAQWPQGFRRQPPAPGNHQAALRRRCATLKRLPSRRTVTPATVKCRHP